MNDIEKQREESAVDRPLRLLRLATVKERTCMGKTTIYECMNEGTFPLPVRLNAKVVAWHENSIDEWIRTRRPTVPRGLG